MMDYWLNVFVMAAFAATVMLLAVGLFYLAGLVISIYGPRAAAGFVIAALSLGVGFSFANDMKRKSK